MVKREGHVTDPGYPDDISPSEIEEDIQRTRAELDATINELSERLRPRNLLENAMNIFRARNPRAGSRMGKSESDTSNVLGDIGSNIADAIREHPLPAALIAAGVGWLVIDMATGRHSGEGGTDAIRRAGRQLRSRAEGMYERGKEKARELSERFTDSGEYAEHHFDEPGRYSSGSGGRMSGHMGGAFGERIREGGEQVTEKLQHGYEHTRDAVSHAVRDYPLAVGAGALAIGVLVGLIMPRTRAEDELMGHTSDEMVHAGREAVREAFSGDEEEPSDAAKRVGRAVQQAAERAKRESE